MFKCYGCGAVFREPEKYVWWTRFQVDEPEIILQCPECRDDRITWLDHDNKNKGEEHEQNTLETVHQS